MRLRCDEMVGSAKARMASGHIWKVRLSIPEGVLHFASPRTKRLADLRPRRLDMPTNVKWKDVSDSVGRLDTDLVREMVEEC